MLFNLLETVLKKWWLLVVSVMVIAAIGIGFAVSTNPPAYTSDQSSVNCNREVSNVAYSDDITGSVQMGNILDMSFAVYNQEASNVVSSGDITSSVPMANTFKYILQSRKMLEQVAEKCDFQITPEEIRECMTVTNEEDTNIIIIRIMTDSAERSYGIAKGFEECYSDVVDIAYPNATLKLCEVRSYASNIKTEYITD